MISSRREKVQEAGGTAATDGAAEVEFKALGSDIRLIVDPASDPAVPPPSEGIAAARHFIERFDSTLSRFRPDSELTRFNSDPRETVPASGLLRTVVRAGTWAARRTGGLVDPTLLAELEEAGYTESRMGSEGLPASFASEVAPTPGAASANASRHYESFEVDDAAGTISRPPGVAFDPGGVGKGLAADMAAGLLEAYPRFLVSCGGDIRAGGELVGQRPFEVFVEHPSSGTKPHFFRLGSGGIATSGVTARSWTGADGVASHHLIDPSSGRPCRTGLISATALAPTALEAEVLAKQALLLGPTEGLALLGRYGGLAVHEDGRVELAGEAGFKLRVPSTESEAVEGNS